MDLELTDDLSAPDNAWALGDVACAWRALVPPNRVSVSEGTKRVLVIKRPGGGSGPWDPLETPYMVRPMDTLAMRRYSAVCFVGPAQTGKTVGLVDGWMAHNVVHDPGDMAIFQMTQDKAREYSKQRLDRAIRNSPRLKAMQSALSRDDNTHDKLFANGMWVRIAWPTASNMASTSYRFVAGTDYDRWPDDIDGEGDGFTLMGKRVTTFLSRGRVMVESSPGRPLIDPGWRPATPHEAPPVKGILGIYNTGDRQRWFWRCPHCREHFEAEPGLGLFRLPSDDELLEGIRELDIRRFAQQYARVPCPHCGGIIKPEQREQLNREALGRELQGWLPEGLTIDYMGRISGTPRQSPVASFWLGGVAATYVKWQTLIEKHCLALLEYEMTGSELQLMTTANTDQGVPYMSLHLREAAAMQKASRYERDRERFIVPKEARFLVATVDVQGGKNARFVVQVMAVGPHQEQWPVDRYAITTSRRPGVSDEFAPLDPASYGEDWDLLTEKVVAATYRVEGSDKELRVKLTMVDSGGEDGVTDKAYAWWRRLRKRPDGLHRRVRLSKGASGRVEWLVKETMAGGERGHEDVPLLLFDPNKFKDMVDASLKRDRPGPGYYHWPEPRSDKFPEGWVTQAFYDELKAEVRNEKGVWEQIRARNETFDLCVLVRVGCMWMGADKRTFWDNEPAWALPLDKGNSEIVTADERRYIKEEAAEPSLAAGPRSDDPYEFIQRRRVRSSIFDG